MARDATSPPNVSDVDQTPDPRLDFVRAHDPNLSLWQSVVAINIRQGTDGQLSNADVLAHPMMQATTDHVRIVMADGKAAMEPGGPRETAAYISHLALETAQAKAAGDDARAAVLAEAARQYSDSDWWAFFAKCASAYINYRIHYRGVLKYNDWKVEGHGDLSYGVIDWKLPNNAVVGIIGDWGTGLDDARMLLRDLMVQHKPS